MRLSVCPSVCLRSADTSVLFTPCTKTTIGQRSFAVSGPATWNNLPSELRLYEHLAASFAKRLKSYLSTIEYCLQRICSYSNLCCINVFIIIIIIIFQIVIQFRNCHKLLYSPTVTGWTNCLTSYNRWR